MTPSAIVPVATAVADITLDDRVLIVHDANAPARAAHLRRAGATRSTPSLGRMPDSP